MTGYYYDPTTYKNYNIYGVWSEYSEGDKMFGVTLSYISERSLIHKS